MTWLRRRWQRAPSAAEADRAIADAQRQRDQAREDRARSQAQLDAERRWFRFQLANGDVDRVAALIEKRLGGEDG